MSGQRESKRATGISRRDFVQGKFWRAFGFGRAPNAESTNSSIRHRQRRALVMRYPKSGAEVSVADDDNSRSVSESESAARRRTIPVLRPPGAVQEEQFLRGCTRCNRCVEVCPHDAIVYAPARLREAAGTPMIDPDHQPCMMCDDFPCIAACEPNVLTALTPKMMGTAKVTEHLCLAHHGTTCTVCSERCPVAGAIEVCEGKPTVNEAECTGCGVCRYVCPAPENAILLMPSFLRPPTTEKPNP